MEQSTAPARTRARLTLTFPEVTDQPSDDVFITEEAFEKYSAIPQLLAAQEELAKGGPGSAAGGGRWMPDAGASYVPFTHPAKRRRTSASVISDSSNATKQSQGMRTEGNGSNEKEDAAGFHNSTQHGDLDLQDGVGGSSFAASHISHETAIPSKRSERPPIQAQLAVTQPQPHAGPGRVTNATARQSAKESLSKDGAASTQGASASAKVPQPLKAKQGGTQQSEGPQQPAQQQPEASAQPMAWSKDLAKGGLAAQMSNPPPRSAPAQAEARAVRMSAAEAARLTARTSADLSQHGFLHTPVKLKSSVSDSSRSKAAHPLDSKGTGRVKRTAAEASAVEEITPRGEAPSRQPAAKAGAGSGRRMTELNKSAAGTKARGRGAARGRGRGRAGIPAEPGRMAERRGFVTGRQLAAEADAGAELAAPKPASPAAEDDDELGDALWADLGGDSPGNSATVEAAASPAPAGEAAEAARKGAEAAGTVPGSRAGSVAEEPAHKASGSRQNSTQALALQPGVGGATELPPGESGAGPAAQPSQDEGPISLAERMRWESEVTRRKYKHKRPFLEIDLVRPVTPVYDPVLHAEIRALQRAAGPLGDAEGRLLSGLTRRQHGWYQTPPEMRPLGQEMANLTDLELSVAEEQRVYMKAAARLGIALNREDLLHCKPAARAQFEADSAAKRPRVESFTQHYRLHTTCALDKVRFGQEPLQLLHVRRVPLPHAPSPCPPFVPVKHRHIFPLEQQFIPAPATGESLSAAGEADKATAFPFRKAATEQLSESSTVLNALEAEDAGAATTSSTLNTLTGLLDEDFGPAWEIPVAVRTGPSGKKVVIMEKALHGRASSLREKHTRLYKWALLSTGLSGGGHAGSPGPACADQSAPSAAATAVAGTAAAGTANTAASAASGSRRGSVCGIYHRPERLDVWQVGRHKLLVRSHDTAVLGEAPAADAQPAAPSEAAPEQGGSAGPSRPATAAVPAAAAPATSQPTAAAATASAATAVSASAMDVSGPGAAWRRANAAAAKEAVGKPVVVRAKAEYHKQKFTQGELITDGELARLWLASCLRLGASVWMGRVHVVNNRLHQAQLFTGTRLDAGATAKGIPQHFAAWLAVLLEELKPLKPGPYLMTHARTSSIVSFFQGIPSPVCKAATKQLPLKGGPVPDAGACYDLWAAHKNSGAVDTDNLDYIHLNWVAPDPTVPHIPFTFVPRPNVPVKKKRQRKIQPTFVTKRHGEDWDTVVGGETDHPSGRAGPAGDIYGEL